MRTMTFSESNQRATRVGYLKARLMCTQGKSYPNFSKVNYLLCHGNLEGASAW